VSLGECCPPEDDAPSACPPSTSRQVSSVGGRKISDGAKFEIMDRSIGGRPHVESLKSQIEEQIEGVPDVLKPFVQPFEREQTEPELRVRGCELKLTWVSLGSYDERL
jgi:hypothetical protein